MDEMSLHRGPENQAGSNQSCKKEFRHSKRSTKMLKDWLSSHMTHPYPTEDEKAQLSEATGMTIRQISYWFVNARRRNIIGSGENTKGACTFPVSGLLTTPEPTRMRSLNDMTPLDRWRHSPPDEEPASWDVISQSLGQNLGSFASEPDLRRVAAPNSIDFSDVSNSSLSSGSSARSYGSESLLSIQSHGSRHKRRRWQKVLSPQQKRLTRSTKDESRMFQCTFCTDKFRTRYDWTRHEGTVHLILEKWTCLPFGPRYCDPSEETMRCALCDEVNPTNEHLEYHGCANCVSKPLSKRSFYRRDHLRQHLRSSHGVSDILPSMKQWKLKVTRVKSRCGFCGDTFTLWSERNDHLAEHFRSGAQMNDWKGCRGLEPAIALLVQNAMPPYLVGAESNDVDPFSGSRAALQASEPGGAVPTHFESLTARLGEFVSKERAKGTAITDDSLRREARVFLYGDDDHLNYTPADNSEWLGLFKQGYGLAPPLGEQEDFSLSCQAPTSQNGISCLMTTLPFTLEKMKQAAVSDSTAIPLDFGSSFPQDQMGQELVIPWAWQTPECLAELSQMCQAQPPDGISNNIMDMGTLAQSDDFVPVLTGLELGIDGSHEQLTESTDRSNKPISARLVERQLEDFWMDRLFHDELFTTK